MMGCSAKPLLILSLLGLAPALLAQAPRRPRGIYAVANVEDSINQEQKANPAITTAQLDAYFDSLYQQLLSGSAVSGLALQVHWDTLNPNAPGSAAPYFWNFVDDAFAQAAAWNAANPTQAPKTIQLIVTPGFQSPRWILAQIPSCDGLFQTPVVTPPSTCGTATFTGYQEGGDGTVLPLPWNPVYKNAWQTFVTALAARYGSNPAFVSIAVDGPTAASAEMILPNDANSNNPQTQFGASITPNNEWIQLLAFHYGGMSAYLKSDQGFIDEWNNAIDMFGEVFSGVTLVATTGNGLPNFNSNFTVPAALSEDCPDPTQDCAAETTVLAHFLGPTAGGANAKATQTSGLEAAREAIAHDMGVAGVKLQSQSTAQLTSPSAQILGGAQFNTSFTNDPLGEGCTSTFPPDASDTPVGCSIPPTCSSEGCLPVACIPQACLAPGITATNLTAYATFNKVPSTDLIPPEQAEYNVLNAYFESTPAASFFGGTTGAAPLNYLQIYSPDIQYAEGCAVYVTGSGWECFDRFQYSASDPISSAWKNLAPSPGNPCGQPAGNQAIAGDIEVLDFEQFSTSKLRISCIDATNRIVYMTGPTGFSQANASESGFIAGNRYLVDNVQDELTQPGQWFLDLSTTPWTLTYLANPGENPNTDDVIVPQIPQVLVASNLQYVTFQGLTFEHDNYTIPAAGHISVELEPDISAAVSFQNSQNITFNSGIVTQTSGSGLEFIPCINGTSPAYCVSNNIDAVVANNLIENSAFYDIGVLGIRIGNPYAAADTDANEAQLTTVQNNVVEGYGRTIPASFGIGQGFGHDNLYTHNDVYDGYHCAISTSQGIPDATKPSGIGNANNVISFNHVYNLLQGIMNDGGSIRIDGGNSVFTAAGNKILNNKIHDVTDASIMDSNGYGGNGVYLDDSTGLVDVENNLVYRVSGNAVYTPHGPAAPNEANTIRNNILAYGRLDMVTVNFPYPNGVPSAIPQDFVVSNNLFYFDRSETSSPKFYVQGGCLYAGGVAFTQFQEWSSNLYWRTDSAFASDAKAFAVQPSPGTGGDAPCNSNTSDYTFFTFAQWQQTEGEDAASVVKNPGFNNPAYPADDYSPPNGSPGVGFVAFNPNLAGRSNPVILPPSIPATFVTKTYNPATDY